MGPPVVQKPLNPRREVGGGESKGKTIRARALPLRGPAAIRDYQSDGAEAAAGIAFSGVGKSPGVTRVCETCLNRFDRLCETAGGNIGGVIPPPPPPPNDGSGAGASGPLGAFCRTGPPCTGGCRQPVMNRELTHNSAAAMVSRRMKRSLLRERFRSSVAGTGWC